MLTRLPDRSQIARRTPPPSTSSICSVRQPWWAPSPHQAATNSPRRNGRESASTRWDWPSPSSPSAQRRLRTMWAVSCPAPPSTRGATRRRFLLPPFFTFSPFLLFFPPLVLMSPLRATHASAAHASAAHASAAARHEGPHFKTSFLAGSSAAPWVCVAYSL